MAASAGAIKVDLTLDATDLGSQITKSVQQSLKPALETVQKDVAKVNTAVKNVDGSGFTKLARNADSAAASTKKAADSAKGYQSAANGISKATQIVTDGLGKLGINTGGAADAVSSLAGGVGGLTPKMAAMAAGAAAGVVAIAAIAAGAIAATKAAYDLGAKFDELNDKLAIKTNKTGPELEALRNSIEKLGRTNTPEDLSKIADVAIDVTRNLKLTGQPLEELTSRLTNLNRMTGDTTNIKSLSQAYKKFGVEGADQVKSLNQLFEISRDTGLTVNDLAGSLDKGGVALREAGLGFGESAALLGVLAENGTDASEIIPGLTRSLAAMAKDGKSSSVVLRDNVDAIRNLINSGQGDKAKDLSNKLFGARGGLQFFNAIKTGALDIDNLSAALTNMGTDINQVSAETSDWSEQWKITKNAIESAAAPVSSFVFDQINGALSGLSDWVSTHQEEIINFFTTIGHAGITAFDVLGNIIGNTVEGFGLLVQGIGDALGGINKFDAWMARRSGDTARADELTKQAEAYFGWGEGITAAGRAMGDFDPTEMHAKLDEAAGKAREAAKETDALGQSLDAVDGKNPAIAIDTTGITQGIEAANGELADFYQQWAEMVIHPQLGDPAVVGSMAGGLIGAGYAKGGAIYGGIPGRDSVPALLMPGEHVLTTAEVRALGGHAGVYALRAAARGGLRGFEGGGAVDGSTAVITNGDTLFDVFTRALKPLLDAVVVIRDRMDKGAAGGKGALEPGGKGSGKEPVPSPLAGLEELIKTGNYNGVLNRSGLAEDSAVVDELLKARDQAGGDIAPLLEGVKTLLEKGDYTGTLSKYGLMEDSPAVDALLSMRQDISTLATSRGKGGGVFDISKPGLASEKGLVQNAVSLNRIISQAFPGLKEIGGWRQDAMPDHPSGESLDIMAGGADGKRINEWLLKNAKALGLQYTLFQQQQFNADGTIKAMEDRGSPTANHMDHVHARVDPNATIDLSAIDGMPSGLSAGKGGGNSDLIAAVNEVRDAVLMTSGYPTGPLTSVGKSAAGGAGAGTPGAALAESLINAGGGVANQVSQEVLDQVYGLYGDPNAPRPPDAELVQLLKERNPAALAAAAGFSVQDFTRQGGGASAQDIMSAGGPGYNAKGQLYSDTADLLDRTLTSQEAANEARQKQLLDILGQVNKKLGEEVLGPVMESAVASGVSQISSTVTAQIGQSMGQAAGPEIASAVRSAMPSDGNSGAGDLVTAAGTAATGALFDTGGIMPSGTFGVNLSGKDERVLSPEQTKLFDRGLLGGWNMQPQQQHRASVGGVIGNETVGAEFFGVSQIPVLGMVVNLLIRVLLGVLGVQIEVRDTLNEMTDEVRAFRGDFEAFDATGRLYQDSSGLLDRSGSSEQAVADERIRILKIVIEALIKYIIEKVIVPMAKAVANAAIQAGASAAGGAINAQAPGAGSAVEGIISAAGSAAVDIAAEVGTDIALAVTEVLIDMIAEALQSYFPDLTDALFGGKLIEMLMGPLSSLIDTLLLGPLGMITNALGALGALLGGIFGSILPFDQGGVARGTGLMPKATLRPERVLSPQQTASFDRLVNALTSGTLSTRSTTIHAPFTVVGGERGGREARDRLLALMS